MTFLHRVYTKKRRNCGVAAITHGVLATLFCCITLSVPALAENADAPAYTVDGESSQSATLLEITRNFYTYDNLDFIEIPKKTFFDPQTVNVISQDTDNRILIETYNGPQWLILREEYTKIVNPYRPYSYEQQIRDCIELESMYPDIIDVSEIGRSVEGRQIISVKLGRGEKSIFMVGSHHAREYISSTFLMKMIDEYAYAYYATEDFGGYGMKELLDNVTIHVVVMLNPDGVNLVQNGPDAVKDYEAFSKIEMMDSDFRQWKNNINGVNLNVNYPAEWSAKSSSDSPDSGKFKGWAAGSEPETQVIMNYTRQNNFLLAASLHTKGEAIYWADKRTIKMNKDQKQIAQVISEALEYELLPISTNPSEYAAGYENWFRAEFGRPAFCIEMTPQNFTNTPHDDVDFDALVWNKAKCLGAVLAAEVMRL